MKAVIFNGARSDDPPIDALESMFVKLLTQRGWEVESICLREKQIAGCLGCFGCWVKTRGYVLSTTLAENPPKEPSRVICLFG